MNSNIFRLIEAQSYILRNFNRNLTLDALNYDYINYDFGHNNSKVEECFAGLLLSVFFPDEFCDLDFSGERPDLRNEKLDVGIEVTRHIHQGDEEISGILNNIKLKKARNVEKQLKRLEELGVSIRDGVCDCPVRFSCCREIVDVIGTKLQKLNEDTFRKYKRNFLFIRKDCSLLTDELEYILRKTIDMKTKYKNYFNEIYIYTMGNFISFDLDNEVVREYGNDVKNSFALSLYARRLVRDSLKQRC